MNETPLELLLQATRLLSSKLELPDLLTTVMEMASRVVGAERASILLLDPATHELYFDVALDLRQTAKKIRLKPGQGIAGWCAEQGKPLIVNDVSSDPRWSKTVDQSSGFVTRSILAAPIKLKGEVIGVVEAINHIGGPFSERDLSHFEAFASQCAVAIDNARLFSSVRQEKRNLQTVLDTIQEGALSVDPYGRVVLANLAAQRLLGLEADLLATALSGFKLDPPLRTIAASHEPAQFEMVREEPKKLVLAGSALPLPSGGQVWIFRDVTTERLEERLKRSFLSLISHKLRTPLASILGYSQVLLDGEPSASAKPAILAVQRQGQKLNRLVDKLLGFVTLEGADGPVELEIVDLDNCVREALVRNEELLEEKRVAVQRNWVPLRVRANAPLMAGVLANLIENAAKFNTSQAPKLDIKFEDVGGEVAVTVSDNGPGIPPEEQELVFHGFHQVDPDFTGQIEGWGLGLPFARRAIERQGGALTLDSKIGHGTRVRFTIAKAPPDGAKKP
jgi:signal transduction histidine kinase